MKHSFLAHVRACLSAALAATMALLPILLVQLAVFQPQGMRVASVGEAFFMALMILVMSPFAFGCFLLGAVAIGPASYAGLKLVRGSSATIAVGLAGLSSAIAARLMYPHMGDGDIEIVTSVAIAGAVGGLVFQRRLDQSLTPPSAPPS